MGALRRGRAAGDEHADAGQGELTTLLASLAIAAALPATYPDGSFSAAGFLQSNVKEDAWPSLRGFVEARPCRKPPCPLRVHDGDPKQGVVVNLREGLDPPANGTFVVIQGHKSGAAMAAVDWRRADDGKPDPADPFGHTPLATRPNCGPEDRWHFDETIASKDAVAALVRTRKLNDWVKLDDFQRQGKVDWAAVARAVTEERVGSRTVWSLRFNPQTCSGFTLRVTSDGHVSLYGCCGK